MELETGTSSVHVKTTDKTELFPPLREELGFRRLWDSILETVHVVGSEGFRSCVSRQQNKKFWDQTLWILIETMLKVYFYSVIYYSEHTFFLENTEFSQNIVPL